MTRLEEKIYDHISTNGQYNYSLDMSVKVTEHQAVKSLDENGYINILDKTIGYVIADTIG